MKSLTIAVIQAMLAGALLAACATNPAAPGGTSSAEVQRPASERPLTSDAQERARTHTELGMAYFTGRRYDVALDEARIALAYDAGYAPAHHLNALVLMALDDVSTARTSFERAAQLAPGDPEINNSYGWFLCTQGRIEAGLDRLAQAARNPYYATPTRPLTNRGLCYLLQKDEAAAETEFRRAVRADAGNIQALLNLAAIAYRRDNHEAAHAYLNQTHQRSQPTAESLWLGVRIERSRGDAAAEASYASQLKSRFPTSPEYQALIEGKYE